ncbi:MAG: hypothetical protein A2Y40_01560 [Candidatus Margulisbacteria bacterium GWF2_35_9]|nr:MAG: hypothetical protein A2Y40_01560 [Candidatus Margulisbacteria bacterium GWF2_35_9]
MRWKITSIRSISNSYLSEMGDSQFVIISEFISGTEAAIDELEKRINSLRQLISRDIPVLPTAIKSELDKIDSIRLGMNQKRNQLVDDVDMKAFDNFRIFIQDAINPFKFYNHLEGFFRKYFQKTTLPMIPKSEIKELLDLLAHSLQHDLRKGLIHLESYINRLQNIENQMQTVSKRDSAVLNLLRLKDDMLLPVNSKMPLGRFITRYLFQLGAHQICNKVLLLLDEGKVFAGPFENLLFEHEDGLYISYVPSVLVKHNGGKELPFKLDSLFPDEKEANIMNEKISTLLFILETKLHELNKGVLTLKSIKELLLDLKECFFAIREVRQTIMDRGLINTSFQQTMVDNIFFSTENEVDMLLKNDDKRSKSTITHVTNILEEMERRSADFKDQIASGEFYAAGFEHVDLAFETKEFEIFNSGFSSEDLALMDLLSRDDEHLKPAHRRDSNIKVIIDYYLSRGARSIALKIEENLRENKVFSGPFSKIAFQVDGIIYLSHGIDVRNPSF